MRLLTETRPCSDWGPEYRAGDKFMLAYIASRRNAIDQFAKGIPYGLTNERLYEITDMFDADMRAQSGDLKR